MLNKRLNAHVTQNIYSHNHLLKYDTITLKYDIITLKYDTITLKYGTISFVVHLYQVPCLPYLMHSDFI